MISITYSAEQKVLAEIIRDDLSKAGFEPNQPVLLILVSAESNNDPSVQDEIKRGINKGMTIVPILAEKVAVPEQLDAYKPLNLSAGYKRAPLLTRLTQSTMTRDDVKKANRLAFTFIGGLAFVMFAAAVLGIMGGVVGFPIAEYNEEATFQAEWVNGLIVETLEFVQPRSTQDAENFPATLEAAPTRLFLYIRETATALPNSTPMPDIQGD